MRNECCMWPVAVGHRSFPYRLNPLLLCVCVRACVHMCVWGGGVGAGGGCVRACVRTCLPACLPACVCVCACLRPVLWQQFREGCFAQGWCGGWSTAGTGSCGRICQRNRSWSGGHVVISSTIVHLLTSFCNLAWC